MRTHETYGQVMASPLMTPPLQQVYWALWPTEGLTRGEVERSCLTAGYAKDASLSWDKALPLLVKMGLAKRGSKRHCPVKQKEEVTWVLTDLAVPVAPKPNKPSGKQYLKAIAQLEAVINHHDQRGDGFITPELRKLYEWVRGKIPTA